MGLIVILSVSGTIFQNIAAQKIGQIIPDASFSDVIQLTAGTHSMIYKSLGPVLQAEVVEQITFALRNVFFVMLAGSALAFIGSFFLNVGVSVKFLYFTNPNSVESFNENIEVTRNYYGSRKQQCHRPFSVFIYSWLGEIVIIIEH